MPGLISNLFDPDEGENHQVNTTTVEGDGQTGVELSPSVTIEMSGSHENADGSTEQWSNTSEVGTDIDLDAAIATSTSFVVDDMTN